MRQDTQAEAVFFDIRDTLGVVDRKGHLVKYKPSTDQLLAAMKSAVGLRIGLITNLPQDVSADAGWKMVEEAGLARFVDREGFVTNHSAGAEKPRAEIYSHAARQLGVPIEKCLFVGENIVEVIGAEAAGMRALLKPFPPGREFLFRPISAQDSTPTSSGRLSEILMEEEHLLGKRIVGGAVRLLQRLSAPDTAQAASAAEMPLRAMGLLVWLTQNFVDPFHHRKEEEVLIPFAQMRGLSAEACAFVTLEHDQGRAYFRGMDLALRRVRAGDGRAVRDYCACLSGFIELYKEHGRKEDDVLFKALGERLSPLDDALVVDLMGRLGPADLTLYLTLVSELELEVGA